MASFCNTHFQRVHPCARYDSRVCDFFNTFFMLVFRLSFACRISLKHINIALRTLKTEKDAHEKSVLERVLAMDNDAKIAAILALDLFLVGIDTVIKYINIYILRMR